jgi:diadenylate cyclase
VHHEIVSLFTGWLEWQNWSNRLEVGILFLLIYLFLIYLRGTRGERIIRALGLFLVITMVGLVQLVRLAGLSNLEFLLDSFIGTLLIALLIIFQPELRRGLIRMGSRNPFLGQELTETGMVAVLASVSLKFSKNKVGALMVIERQAGLKTYLESGTGLDAEISSGLLSTIFFPGTALHDGAVIISGGRLKAAGCLLPLSENTEISKALGTRHRAAVGMAEESDAVVIVVSEETGAISLAVHGKLEQKLDKNQLTQKLTHLLFEAEEEEYAPRPIQTGAAR